MHFRQDIKQQNVILSYWLLRNKTNSGIICIHAKTKKSRESNITNVCECLLSKHGVLFQISAADWVSWWLHKVARCFASLAENLRRPLHTHCDCMLFGNDNGHIIICCLYYSSPCLPPPSAVLVVWEMIWHFRGCRGASWCCSPDCGLVSKPCRERLRSPVGR